MSGAFLSGIGAAGALASAVTEGPLGALLGFGGGPVVLGSVVFTDQEVPATIRWGGGQKLNVHKLPGGGRVIDAMGRDDMAISWSGRMIGAGSDARAAQLDLMRVSGQPQALQWGPHLLTVVVSQFEGSDQAFMTEYRITCEVLRDESGQPGNEFTTLLGQITDDINFGIALYSQVLTIAATGQAISNGMTGLQTTVQNVGTLTAGDANATALATSVAAESALCASAITAGEAAPVLINTVGAYTGTVFATTDPVQGIVNLSSASTSAAGQAGALAVQGVLGRTALNLDAVNGATLANASFAIPTPPPQTIGGSAGTVVTTAGGSLFAIAAQQLGDATQWYRIAQASNLTDPMLNSGLVTLNIPDAIQAPSNGIPSAVNVTII